MDGIGREFMDKTRYAHLGLSAQQHGMPQPPLQAELAAGCSIDLPDPGKVSVGTFDLRRAIEGRRSLRSYADRAFSLDELSFLLWCTQGIRDRVPGKATFRTVPSAGARHPFETAVFVRRVDGLDAGLYQYLSMDQRLVSFDTPGDLDERMTAACLGQEIAATCALLFVWVADSQRMTWRYGERGYRYLHLDAGHVCQNLYLAAEAIEAGACAIGAFDDDAVNDLLGIDGVDRFAVYLAAVGKRPPAKSPGA